MHVYKYIIIWYVIRTLTKAELFLPGILHENVIFFMNRAFLIYNYANNLQIFMISVRSLYTYYRG